MTLEEWKRYARDIHKYVDAEEVHDAMIDIAKRLARTDIDRDILNVVRKDFHKVERFIWMMFQEEENSNRPASQTREPPEAPRKAKSNDKSAKYKWLLQMIDYWQGIIRQFDERDEDAFSHDPHQLNGAPELSNANGYPEFKLNEPAPEHSAAKDDFKCYMKAVDVWIEWAHKLNGDDRTYWLANAGNLCTTPNIKTFTNSKYAQRNQSWANLTVAKILYGTDNVLNANKILQYQAIYPNADLTKWEPNEDRPAPQYAQRLKGNDPKGKGKAKTTPRRRPVILPNPDVSHIWAYRRSGLTTIECVER
ncbi:hypothetical protein FANTH_13698 [Fusarium anthophilum]|uniref:Uncharacterized protein n=1 Tax=Fusarium anthophilum TaxID=48485 RepID=A0A8H4YMX4_9HYPO|nr:hypothetical protein FANTH_13698 [Fusarium anthophilum]